MPEKFSFYFLLLKQIFSLSTFISLRLLLMYILKSKEMLLFATLLFTTSVYNTNSIWPSPQITSCAVKSLSLASMAGKWKLISNKRKVPSELKQMKTLTINEAGNGAIALQWGEGEPEEMKIVALYKQLDPEQQPGVFGTIVENPDGEEVAVPMSVIAFQPAKYMILYTDVGGGDYGFYKVSGLFIANHFIAANSSQVKNCSFIGFHS